MRDKRPTRERTMDDVEKQLLNQQQLINAFVEKVCAVLCLAAASLLGFPKAVETVANCSLRARRQAQDRV